ncbi:uncharacterized protein LOC136036415 [Artemia franciscana]|uniref:uncharacterized protein LOC136036415 n=1 Tax=Artemia franciscana TaxID=6661 RepID=UPI0032DB5F1D
MLHEAEKEGGFLRIGSINVRVKKTTEKFNNLLGGDRISHFATEKKYKSWGSIDNIQSTIDRQLMPPPKGIKKKRSKEWPAVEKPMIHIVNSPGLAPIHSESEDTDSDSAYGFGSDWTA